MTVYQENNAFFIATRQTVTYGQTEGVCPTVSDFILFLEKNIYLWEQALDDKLFCNETSKSICKSGQSIPNTFGKTIR